MEETDVHDDDPFHHGHRRTDLSRPRIAAEKESLRLGLPCHHPKSGRAIGGEGVVGEQPVIEPGESFNYTSGTPLSTPSGIMQGNYYMETHDGRSLEIEIPAFSLDSPGERPQIH
jgi:hypothetical protein